MAREGHGVPGRIVLKNQPKLTLANLLRRRKTTLAKFVVELGVTTHSGLLQWCNRMGVIAPSTEEFTEAFPGAARVNSAREGVVVLEAPPVIDEPSGAVIDPDAPIHAPGVTVLTSSSFLPTVEGVTSAVQRKSRRTAPLIETQKTDSD